MLESRVVALALARCPSKCDVCFGVRDRHAGMVIHPTSMQTGPTRLAPRVTNAGLRERIPQAGEDLGRAIRDQFVSSEIGCSEAIAEAVSRQADPHPGGTGGREIDARITDHDRSIEADPRLCDEVLESGRDPAFEETVRRRR